MKLNLACGNLRKPDYINVDNNPTCQPDKLHDIIYGIPYSDETVEEILCEHFIEHLDGEQFIRFFNECWRVLKVGGKLEIAAPYHSMKWAIIDPSHKRFISEHSFDFFMNRDYNSVTAGVKGWYLGVSCVLNGGELRVVLEKTLMPSASGHSWTVQKTEEKK